MTDIAQVKTPDQAAVGRGMQILHDNWIGALRGEYRVATRAWDFFCPVWHTGQAVKALVLASSVLGDGPLGGARAGAEFIMNARVTEGEDKGLILAYEDHPDKVNTSAILECLDGLFHLADATGETRYRDAAIEALDWVASRAYRKGEGLFNDLYDPKARTFAPDAYGCAGRPLLDDAVFVKGFRLTGRKDFLEVAVETAERLLRDEGPPGNWVMYPPCKKNTGSIHPRHAYWWGFPMKAVYEETGDTRFLECYQRSIAWYGQALRRDGGLFRGTYTDFSTDSFGHATSGVGSAAIMALAEYERTGSDEMAERALAFCQSMQFTEPGDPNLRGAILEKVLPPKGTDASPYHIRDLGTIFFAQAASLALTSDAWKARGEGSPGKGAGGRW